MRHYHYLQPYKGYFWQWEDNYNVVAIPNSSTIAYKEYLVQVLENLSPQGLPFFGSLLLSIIALNPNGEQALDSVYKIVSGLIKTTDDVILSNGFDFLRLLTSLPQPYKEGKKRQLLLQTLFADCHNKFSSIEARKIIGNLKAGSRLDTQNEEWAKIAYAQDFKTIGLLRKKFETAEDIMASLASIPGIDEELVLEDHAGKSDEDADIVEQLINHSKTTTVGTLIKHIWSGLDIPFHSALPSVQPLGGVSDLTNKGEFDKLLISEFANDDLVFLSRLANNEALYIHREIPPVKNNLQRIILIDISLKNWGTPKTVAFAIALAIATHPKTDIDCAAFVVGDRLEPIAIDNIDSIIDAVQRLDGSIDASNGLQSFFYDARFKQHVEVFLITESTTLKHAAMMKVLDEHRDALQYLVLTDAEGNIDLFKRSVKNQKHLQHLKLPLQELWKKTVKEQTPIRTATHVATSVNECPLLLSSPGYAKFILLAPNEEVFQITRSRELIKFTAKRKGWELVYTNLPISPDAAELGYADNGDLIVLLYDRKKPEVILLNTATNEKKSVMLPKRTSDTFIYHDGYFFSSTMMSIAFYDPVFRPTTAPRPPFELKREKLELARQQYSVSSQVFKNIRRIFISDDHKLAFNIHTLSLNFNNSHLKLVTNNNKPVPKIEAHKVNDSEFVFPDGSAVEIFATGIAVLKSSSNEIPSIYIPTTLDMSLGVATNKVFAGNEFYRKELLFDISLQRPENRIMSVIKLLVESLQIDLQLAQKIVSNDPIKFPGHFTRERTNHLKILFETNAFSLTINPVNHSHEFSELEIIDVHQFYRKYIDSFIHTIVKHAASR